MNANSAEKIEKTRSVVRRVRDLIDRMTLAEKVGQMNQLNAGNGYPPDHLGDALRGGQIGSILNQVDVNINNELQRIAVEESRLGIPLLIGRDVIHGYKTVMPIPLGQAASWNPELVRECARVAAQEAAASGVNWTFAPMIDVSRDPRWGRIAESFGEDPFLTSVLGASMVRGFQGEDIAGAGTIAACAKHFAGYGAAESGRDYATTNISENELRNVYLPPFKSALDAGVTSFMSSFSDIDGVPASANEFLLRRVLREEWGFDGLVVSDWDSVRQLKIHGLTADDRESALAAVTAGVDMEMAGDAYVSHIADLVGEGRIDVEMIDAMVSNILRAKIRLGLFESPYTDPGDHPASGSDYALAVAKRAAVQSVVMLKNDHDVLPLCVEKLSSLAIIGPLADAPYEQLGTWIFDGDVELSVTALDAIRAMVDKKLDIRYCRAMETSRSKSSEAIDDAVKIAADADATLLFLGEESILSGEAHSRADIDLPGAQEELVRRVRASGKPVIAVIMAGRPLTLNKITDQVDAILYAWHPGSMGGPAIADLLFGVESPSGKLPATFPRMVGQIPIYYNQKNTGKPPSDDTVVHIDDIDANAPQTSFGMTAFHLDAGYKPLFAFGHGLSYATFRYRNISVSKRELRIGSAMSVSVELTNESDVAADEVVQMYVRDLVGNVTRPVRELKGFQRVHVEPGQTVAVRFELHSDDLAFYGREMTLMTEPGDFHVWIGGSSTAELRAEFRLVENT